MTRNQMEIISDNLRAYKNNFGYIEIEEENYGEGYYVFTSEERKNLEAIHNIVIISTT